MRRYLALPCCAAALVAAACGHGQSSGTAPPATEVAASSRAGSLPTSPESSAASEPVTSAAAPAAAPAGSASLPRSLRGHEWSRLPTTSRVVALTFDAGANAAGMPKILAALRRAHAPATFFLTGRWVDAYPSYARAVGAVYPVGNHTLDHPHMTRLSDAAVRRQLRAAQRRIVARTGRDPRPLFRFPFGESDARTIRLVNALGYGSIRWTVDTLGWKGTSGGQTAASVLARVLAGLRPGEIVLMHVGSNPDDGTTLDADALPRVIRAVRARGYRLTTVDRFLHA